MIRIDAFVRSIRGKALPDDAQLISNDNISTEQMTVLIEGINSHMNEGNDYNLGLLLSIAIGFFFLILLLCLTIQNCRRANAMSKTGGNTNRLYP